MSKDTFMYCGLVYSFGHSVDVVKKLSKRFIGARKEIGQLRAENARLQAVAEAARKMREHFATFHGARLTAVDVLAIMAVNTALAALDAEPEKKEG